MLGDSSGGGGGGGGGGVQLRTRISSAETSGGASEAVQLEIGGGGSSNSGGDDDNMNRHGGAIDESGGSGSGSGFFGGGNRWPRQETLALLKIRSDMDVTFRDSNVKGPLWEEVSRKLSELGYHRSAKKCKEKFENVYKYHRRTKESRTGKSQGKTYRFFEQLQALDHQHNHHHHHLITPPTSQNPMPLPNITTSVTSTHPIVAMPQTIVAPQTSTIFTNTSQPLPTTTTVVTPLHTTAASTNPFSSSFGTDMSTSSSTSSDVELGGVGRKRKRKWKDFFERLMKEVIDKQEELQKKFLEAIEKREMDRMVREEAWRMQEMSRINREREILAQERSMAAAKDAAVMAFLQKISEQPNNNFALPPQPLPNPTPTPRPPQPPQPEASPPPQPAPVVNPPPLKVSHRQAPRPPQPLQMPQQPGALNLETVKMDNGGGDDQNLTPTSASAGASSSRWPKIEVEALIKIRTNLDSKYQENGPKGPLWEEISSEMRKVGYNRNSKRCKEKWENINKYFKKVKESNKKRPEDSKTCPYFNQLDALYKEKNKLEASNSTSTSTSNTNYLQQPLVTKPEQNAAIAPLMVRPEQQWPPAAAAASVGQKLHYRSATLID
ncbi:hypothetical protein ACFE04_014258 [Oxalis oulophora]